jgi:hypothetical protein
MLNKLRWMICALGETLLICCDMSLPYFILAVGQMTLKEVTC